MKPIHTIGLIGLAIAVIIGMNSLFIVKETNQAMVLTLGKVDRLISEPGLKFKVPFIQNIVMFDKRILETDATPTEYVTKDKKRLLVDSFTRWQIVNARKFYESVRNENLALERINIIVNSAMRSYLGREDLVEIVSGDRAKMMQSILENARVQAEPLGVEIVDVRIKRSDLPEENSRAIYQRMRAEREKESKEIRAQGEEEAQKIRADADKQRTILLAEANRDSEKLRGEGDALSIKITGTAFNKDPEFYSFMRSLDAYRAGLKGENTYMVLDSDMSFFKQFSK
ncbi:MAG: protease modulator HflC [Pseudomonadota bacterium]|nr:protease modulator HflC [Pseudomonadota bacterium]